jgi:5-formyltetrahydrofolate cyclo-ligase
MLKDELREYISQQKRQFTPRQLAQLSLPVLDRLRPLLSDAKVILAYYSLPDEVDTHVLIHELVAEGKTVLLPKVLDDTTMELRRYTGPQDLSEGAFHIMEPMGVPFTDLSQIDVALIPGIAFDSQGHRLGRGKGYYDRFLTAYTGKTLGICFDFQKVAEVPVDAHDVAVDRIV